MTDTKDKTTLVRELLLQASIAVLYFVTARLGLALHSIDGVAALIWPPTAVALSATLIFGLRVWPAILVGCFVVDYLTGVPPVSVVGMVLANTTEPLIGCLLIHWRRWPGTPGETSFDRSLESKQDVIRLLIGGALGSTLICTIIGVGSLWLGGVVQTEHLWHVSAQWWAGNVLSNLAITPLVLVFSRPQKHPRLAFSNGPVIEKVAFAVVLATICVFTLSNASTLLHLQPRNVYLLSPILVWATVRWGQRGAALATFVMSNLASWYLAQAQGPFHAGNLDVQLLNLVAFVATIAVTGLFVASIVTEREAEREALHQREIEVRQAKIAADSASLAKSTFLANMSHEIRTPLGAVVGFSELVADPQVPEPEKKGYVDAIRRNGELVSSLINDILDLSKIEAGKMEASFRDSPLSEILTDTKTGLDLQAKEKGVSLEVDVAPGVPGMIRTDPLRLRQILINIIGNAIKFTAKGAVEVRLAMEGAKLAIYVKDSGRGISEEQAKRLFAPFSQVDSSSKRKHGGAGLGLVLSKRLAMLLGGDVELFSSRLDEGSTFRVTIDPGPLREVVEVAPRRREAPTTARLDGLRVLLTDDAVDNRVLVSRILKLAGAEVDLASNGREAVSKIRDAKYDVVLMDLQMPVMDGYEATRELRGSGYHGTIIALTAHALADEREKCLASGFDDHLSKPINRESLVVRLLESRAQREA